MVSYCYDCNIQSFNKHDFVHFVQLFLLLHGSMPPKNHKNGDNKLLEFNDLFGLTPQLAKGLIQCTGKLIKRAQLHAANDQNGLMLQSDCFNYRKTWEGSERKIILVF